MSRRKRMFDPLGGSISGGLHRLGSSLSRWSKRGEKKVDKMRHQYNVDRDRVSTLLNRTGAGPLSIERPKWGSGK